MPPWRPEPARADRPAPLVTVGDSGTPRRFVRSCGRNLPSASVPLSSCFGRRCPQVHTAIATLYRDFDWSNDARGAHFVIRADAPSCCGGSIRTQAQFTFDGRQPFIPLPGAMAAPMLEAGLNWCIGTWANQFLVLHSATLERGGRALLMPRRPARARAPSARRWSIVAGGCCPTSSR